MSFIKCINLLWMILLLGGCQLGYTPEPLPTPEAVCSLHFEWRGLQPGVSTVKDAIQALGWPDQTSRVEYGDKKLVEYVYVSGEAPLSETQEIRVLFRNGIVDWIEIPFTEPDILFPSVKDMYGELGALDTIYTNNNYNPAYQMLDVLSGPAKVYVWSGCGLAAIGMPNYLIDADKKLHQLPEEERNKDSVLEVLYPPPRNERDDIARTTEAAILVEVLFIPTSYEGFKQAYQYQFPYFDKLQWDKIKSHK